MRKQYRHQPLAPRLLKNLSGATDWTHSNMLSLHVHLSAALFEISDLNPGVTLIVRATDGLFVYYRDVVEFYVHFRKKHILLHANSGTDVAKSGDDWFGETHRHHGSWDAMWRLSSKEQIDALLTYAARLPIAPIVEELEASRSIPSWVKTVVHERDRGRCRVCGSKRDLHFDHVYPFSWGGTSRLPSNVQLLCAAHNLEKSASLKY